MVSPSHRSFTTRLRTRSFLILVLFFASCLAPFFARAHFFERSEKGDPRSHHEPARLSPKVTVHAAGRGNPKINLSDGHDLLSSYVGPEELTSALVQNLVEPLSLAAADFDEDGVPDLVSGYAYKGRGVITLNRGNVDSIYPNAPEAKQRKVDGTFTPAPFLSPGRVFDAPVTANFLAAGDFDADAHWDLVVGSRTSNELHLLSGDGGGGLRLSKQIPLPGALTAMTTGEINRADGLTDIVVAVESGSSPQILIFEGPEGALRSQPEVFAAPSTVTSLALCQLDDHKAIDLAIASGNQLVTIFGRDRKLSLSSRDQATVRIAETSARRFPFSLRAIAAGDFWGANDGVSDLALLADDGSVQILLPPKHSIQDPLASGKQSTAGRSLESWEVAGLGIERPGASNLTTANVSTNLGDDLLLLDPVTQQLEVLTPVRIESKTELISPWPKIQVAAAFKIDSNPRSLLTMRLDSDAVDDLVLTRSGASAPSASLSTLAKKASNVGSETAIFENRSPITINSVIDPSGTTPPMKATPYPSTITVSGQPTVEKVRVRLNRIKHSSLPQVSVLLVAPNGQTGVVMSGAGRPADSLDVSLTFDDSAERTIPQNEPTTSGTYKPTVSPFRPVPEFPAPAPAGPYPAALSGFNGINPNGTWALYVLDTPMFGGGEIAEGWTLILGPDSPPIPFVVTNTNDSGPGSLRQAILDANASLGADIINFSIGSGPQTIKPETPLPAITDPVTIDGTSQPGFAGKPIIELTGREPDFFGPALNITSGQSVVRGLVINKFIGGPFRGIQLIFGGHNIIEGNFIGTDLSGTVALSRGNLSADNTAMIGVDINTSDNLIGGTTIAARNVISGNSWGIFLDRCTYDDPVTGNVIQGNFIGTDVTGTQLLENGTGITTGAEGFCGGGSETLIGGTVAGARNIIVGGSFRIHFVGAGSSLVQGNYIGTDVTGAVDLDAANPSNRGNGVDISQYSENVTVGGTTAAARNVISGNWYGIQISGSQTSGTLVQGNYIGTNANGSTRLNNLFSGVYLLFGTANNTVGGAVDGARNIISGNDRHGVEIGKLDKVSTTNNVIQGNYIGTDATGTMPVGNGNLFAGDGDGVNVPANADGNRITDNLISFNSNSGVFMPNVAASNNSPGIRIEITGNSIFANGSQGIDLGDQGVTANDLGDPDAGPNNLQNFPVLSLMGISSPGVFEDSAAPRTGANAIGTVNGTLNSTPNATFTVHWYFSADAQCVRNQAGSRPLVTGKVPGVVTNASGNASFSVQFDLPNGVDGGIVNCTATDVQGNTSEYSACLPVGTAPPSGTPTPTPTPTATPTPPANPDNDSFSNALAIGGNSGRALSNNISATKETMEPNHAANVGGKSVWFRWQAPSDSVVTLTTFGSSFDTLLGVYTGSSVSGLTTIASNDDDEAGGALTSMLTFQAVAGRVYNIAVDGVCAYQPLGGNCVSDGGGIALTWNANPLTPRPTIFVEQGTNNLAAVDSVSLVRGPFALTNSHNYSNDQRTRIIFFTTDLGLAQTAQPDINTLAVLVGGNSYTVESVGPNMTIGGSNIVFRLPDLSPGTYPLGIRLNGANSTNSPNLIIIASPSSPALAPKSNKLRVAEFLLLSVIDLFFSART